MIYVRAEGPRPDEGVRACDAAALAAEGGAVRVEASTPVSSREQGPFEPLALALEHDGVLRDRLADGLRPPSLGPWRRARLVALGLAATPMLFLLELDRELLGAGRTSGGRALVDVVLAAYVAWELTRRTPRMPAVAAAALAAAALRFALVVSERCGAAPAIVWAALALASAAAALVLWRAPSRERVSLEIAGKLGISRSDAFTAKLPPDAPGALVAASLGAAVGLPLVRYGAREAGFDLVAQAAMLGAYALAAPAAVRWLLDRGPTAAGPSRLRVLVAIFTGLALAGALTTGASRFFEAGAEIARCAHKLDGDASRLLAREAAGLASGVAATRASGALALSMITLVPFAEERVFRDLLMRVLVRKYGASYGLLGSSVVFAFAHFGVYDVALYQSVLLGLAFGVAWSEGGLVAAAAVHALHHAILLW